MLKWFRPGLPAIQTALAMVGAKGGDRVLFVGRVDGRLIGEVARATGLNGQTLVGCRPSERQAAEAGAAAAGALIDVVEIPDSERSPVPHGVTEVDVIVAVVDLEVMNIDARRETCSEAIRALRPGGRLIVVDGRQQGFLPSRKTTAMPADVVVPLLTSEGALAARALGVEDGVTYYEARKPR